VDWENNSSISAWQYDGIVKEGVATASNMDSGRAACKRIVEFMGGTIWAESKPGEGATFHFTLPTRHSEGKSAHFLDNGNQRGLLV